MSRSYRFGEFRINPALRELWRGDRPVALPPLVFDCPTYLLEDRDRAIGGDELVASVWDKSVVSDTLLDQTILASAVSSATTQRSSASCARFCASAIVGRAELMSLPA